MTSQNLTLRPSTSGRFDIDLNTWNHRSSPSHRGTCSPGRTASQRERQTCWGRHHRALMTMTRSKWPRRYRESTTFAWPFRRNRDLVCERLMKMKCPKILVVQSSSGGTRLWQPRLHRSNLLRLRPDAIINNYRSLNLRTIFYLQSPYICECPAFLKKDLNQNHIFMFKARKWY